ncbi:MAG TPA: type II toxin-antitoxin system VapC family toxin [Acidimicrobiales bacterium]|nr:type II toxin-antitoxin system VapC family toxin [Acidimicrobiales bacterium]
MNAVLDSSALLAFLQGEAGADVVEEQLGGDAICGAANWSEVAQKVLAAGRDWDLARVLLLSYDIRVEPVTGDDAERAARRWRSGEGLSLADRLCLALADRTGLPVWTADTAWGAGKGVNQIR